MHKARYFGTGSDKTVITDPKQKLNIGKEHKKRDKNQIGHNLGFERSSVFHHRRFDGIGTCFLLIAYECYIDI